MRYVDRESCNNCNYLSLSKKIRFKRIRGRIFSQRKMAKSTNCVGVTRIRNSKPYATIQPLSRRSFIEFNWTCLVAKLVRSKEHYSILSRKRVKNETSIRCDSSQRPALCILPIDNEDFPFHTTHVRKQKREISLSDT